MLCGMFYINSYYYPHEIYTHFQTWYSLLCHRPTCISANIVLHAISIHTVQYMDWSLLHVTNNTRHFYKITIFKLLKKIRTRIITPFSMAIKEVKTNRSWFFNLNRTYIRADKLIWQLNVVCICDFVYVKWSNTYWCTHNHLFRYNNVLTSNKRNPVSNHEPDS